MNSGRSSVSAANKAVVELTNMSFAIFVLFWKWKDATNDEINSHLDIPQAPATSTIQSMIWEGRRGVLAHVSMATNQALMVLKSSPSLQQWKWMTCAPTAAHRMKAGGVCNRMEVQGQFNTGCYGKVMAQQQRLVQCHGLFVRARVLGHVMP
jgi:hypothetical protein